MVEVSWFNDRILFSGYMEDVEASIILMYVFVHASIEPEPFGFVITEAVSYDISVVASDRGTPKVIISDGADGILVNSENTGSLPEPLLSCFIDDELRPRIGGKGRAMPLKHYMLED